MRITYNCFESDTGDGVDQLIELIGGILEGVGGTPIPGFEGWTVSGASLAELLMQLGAWDSDDHLLNASQSIDKSLLLDLTQGRYWTVRRSSMRPTPRRAACSWPDREPCEFTSVKPQDSAGPGSSE